ncbi:hypothetical protein CA54_06790 [Symmachiella macrocystis]|uniref:Uncharacterized protein n=1 Tax=Symmachiella macrocystis TaxID=2527985 RepID=A0A5C6BJM3_9PLAN|nr:hypothetical protein [Symmachiella macrocystis]TWU11867.1 hypothetical protein CA54_06790 [Symmachiella macrocystis]
MDFEKRLERAIERGQHQGDVQAREDAQRKLGEAELKQLHIKYQLELSEQIEDCLRKLADHFPGFRFNTATDERGWGATISRDDLLVEDGRRANSFSRLEMVISPFASVHILELRAKGTIHNKELFRRTRYQMLVEADPESFRQLIDMWVLEYAELYASNA